ncbi:MAG: MBL fold metallo-hydrolase [Chitinophagales bacterium]
MIHTIDLHFLGHSHSIASYLVETSEGPVLIETGPHSVLPNLQKGLAAKGYRLEDIQHVFLTHIHLDHAGAAWWFAEQGATIYVHPFGYPHLAHPEKLLHSAKRIYQDEMQKLWGDMKPIAESQLVAVENEDEFTIGDTTFKAWHTPGHAVHHIAWQVGKNLFTGDVAGVKIEGGKVVPPCPPPDINLEDWQDSIKLIQSLDVDCLYLVHFGAVRDIENHLNHLVDCLWDWANWIKPYWESGKSAAEITPLFEAYAHQQLVDFGIDAEGCARYEAANPSWMSVAGLMRYWHKKTV